MGGGGGGGAVPTPLPMLYLIVDKIWGGGGGGGGGPVPTPLPMLYLKRANTYIYLLSYISSPYSEVRKISEHLSHSHKGSII